MTVLKSKIDNYSKAELAKMLQNHDEVFHHVLEGTMAGYWDWNIPANTEYLSPTFKAMFGYEDHEMENSPESWQKIIYEDDLPGVFDVFNKHISSKGEIPYANECRYYHKDGSIVWVYCKGKVIEWAEDGSPIRMIGSHVDITELKAKEAEAQELNERLITQNETLEQFVYVASHDLQEPMRTITGFSELLQKKYADSLGEEGVEYLNILKQSSNRMTKLISALLDYSRINKKATLQKLNLKVLIEQTAEELSALQVDKKATININVPEFMYFCYPNQLHSLVLNLLSNAIKYAKKDVAPVVDISFDQNDQFIHLSFKDNGIGIEEKYFQRIFEMFQRLHTREEYNGTGIGLSHVKKIAEIHQGHICVKSIYGVGSEFIVTLKKDLL
jgi:PAS domain S-box-containing protein